MQDASAETTRGIKKNTKSQKKIRYRKDKYYKDSGASKSMLFTREMADIEELKKPYEVACGGSDMLVNEIGSLKEVFKQLPLPKDGYYYDKT